MQANNVVPRPITAPIFQLPLRGLEIQGEFKVSSLKGDATRRIERFVRNKEQLSDSSCTLTSVMHMPPIGFPAAVVEYLQPTPPNYGNPISLVVHTARPPRPGQRMCGPRIYRVIAAFFERSSEYSLSEVTCPCRSMSIGSRIKERNSGSIFKENSKNNSVIEEHTVKSRPAPY